MSSIMQGNTSCSLSVTTWLISMSSAFQFHDSLSTIERIQLRYALSAVLDQ